MKAYGLGLPLATIKVKGKRTDCHSGVSQMVDCEMAIFDHDSFHVLYVIEGAITGYESFYFTNRAKERLHNGWSACAGTKGSWDKLEFSAEVMQEVFVKFANYLQKEE